MRRLCTFRRPAVVCGAACTGIFVITLLNSFLNSVTCVANCSNIVRYLSYERLQKNEASKRVKHPVVRSFDVNYLGSNSPIEDRFVTGYGHGLGIGLFSVIDGHKGSRCSHFIQNNLLQYVVSALNVKLDAEREAHVELCMTMNHTSANNEDNLDWMSSSRSSDIPSSVIEECLTTSFKSLDDYISSGALNDAKLVLQGHSLTPDMKERLFRAIQGACVTLAVVQTNSISVATTGDCRVVVGQQQADQSWKAVPLSVDQNAMNILEVERVKRVHPGEEDTVIFNGRILGSLMPFRTFGDVDFKWESKYLNSFVPVWPNYNTPPYVTADPVVTHHNRKGSDRFMVIASDGLWERISNEDVVNIVANTLEQELGHKSAFSLFGRKEKCCRPNAATELLWHALGGTEASVSELLNIPPSYSRMARDDITVMVVFFD